MRAAIYSRYSTDKQDSNSTAAQARNCKALIEREGWTLAATYTDEGISGSDNDRPGYVRLLKDSEAGKFDIVVVDETSRLTRAPGELQRQLAWLKHRGQFLVDCRGYDSRQAGASLLAAVGNYMDEQELEKIVHRTRRGLREAVLLDFSPGGRAYGYSSEPVQTAGKRRWRVVVVPEQAEIVVEIFTMYAGGMGLKAIAESLNERRVPSPGSTWNRTERRCRGWVHTAVRAILKNERYTGLLIWNQSTWSKVPFSSRRIRRERPRDEWVIREIPELEIVAAELFQRVQDRFAKPSRRAHAKARSRGRPPRHLLSGLMYCASCGSNMVIEARGRYACSSRTNGGTSLCSNHLRVDGQVAEDALLSGIQRELLTDDAIRYMQRAVRERLRESQRPVPDVKRLEGNLHKVEAKLERIADAIEVAGLTDTLADRMASLEQERKVLKAEIKTAGQQKAPALPDIIPGLVRRYRELVNGIARLGSDPGVTSEDVQRGRDILRSLFGRIPVEPDGNVLVATVAATGAGFINSNPASINPSFVVAGACYATFRRCLTGFA